MIKVEIGNNYGRHPVILDENTTLRAALEENEVDYSRAIPCLDGATLRPADLDKTFAEMGVTDHCYLLSSIKADNAAAIKVVGNVCVVESKYSVEEYERFEKHRPKALTMTDPEDKKIVTFRVGVGKNNGSLSAYGVSFGGNSANGKACVTMQIPDDVTDVKKWVIETVGTAILNLNKIEEGLESCAEDIVAEEAAIAESVVIL